MANNKRIKTKGWKLVAIFTRKVSTAEEALVAPLQNVFANFLPICIQAYFLRYLDISENNLDKRAAEYFVQAISAVPPPSSNSPSPNPNPTSSPYPLFSDQTSKDSSDFIPPPAFPPTSGDEAPFYDDDCEGGDGPPLFTVAPLLREDGSSSTRPGSLLSLRIENCGLKSGALDALGKRYPPSIFTVHGTDISPLAAHGIRASNLKHLSIRRNRVSPLGAVALAIMIRDYNPISTVDPATTPTTPAFSLPYPDPPSSSNSVTAREALQAPYVRKSLASSSSSTPSRAPSKVQSSEIFTNAAAVAQAEKDTWQNSEARNRLKRQIEELPRTGSLLTLDIKGNDIRVSGFEECGSGEEHKC